MNRGRCQDLGQIFTRIEISVLGEYVKPTKCCPELRGGLVGPKLIQYRRNRLKGPTWHLV
jgi:hypothetical protein